MCGLEISRMLSWIRRLSVPIEQKVRSGGGRGWRS